MLDARHGVHRAAAPADDRRALARPRADHRRAAARRSCSDSRTQGTTIILVEQSVNVALTVAETAYFMEKGEIRFHGPTAELLERPDVLRSVFLEGAASVELDDGRPGRRARRGDAPTRPARRDERRAQRRARPARRPPARGRGRLEALRRHHRARRRLVRRRRRARSRLHRPERRRQDDALRRASPASSRADARHDRARDRRRRRSPSSAPDARARDSASAARSRTAGCSPRSPSRETIAVALERSVEVRDPIAAALHLPSVADSEAKVARRASRSSSSCWASARSATSSCASCRPGAGASSTSRACSRTSRRCCCSTSRRPASPSARPRRSGRCCCASATMTGASLLVIEHDMPLLTSISDRMIALDLGEVVAVGTPTRSSTIPGSSRRTWENPKQSLLAAVPAARCPDRGKHMAASRGSAANGGGTPKSGGTSSGGKLLRRYGPIALVVIVIVGVIAFVGSRGDDDDDVATASGSRAPRTRATCRSRSKRPKSARHGRRLRLGRDLRHRHRPVEDPGAQRTAVHRAVGHSEDNGGATSPGVTADSIIVALYKGEPDPLQQALVEGAGRGYRSDHREPDLDRLPQHVRRRGRDVRPQARHPHDRSERRSGRRDRGPGRRAEGHRHGRVRRARRTRADAGVVAGDRRRQDRVHVRSRGVARPRALDNAPYLWPTGPTPEQADSHLLELVGKQLVGKTGRVRR